MTQLTDIYYKAGKDLAEHGFDAADTQRKKKLVDASLKNYITTKIIEEDFEKVFLLYNDPETSVEDLVEMLGDIIPREQHFDTMRHLTHFILQIAGEMQYWSVVWYQDEDVSFVDNSLAEFNENGKLESLTTHKETSYVDTFKFVHGLFNEVFMEKQVKGQQVRLRK